MRAATSITPGGLDANLDAPRPAEAKVPSPKEPKPTNPKTLLEQRREELKQCDVRYNKVEIIVRIKVGETLFHTTMRTINDKSDNLMYIDATLQLHENRFISTNEAYLTYDRDPKLFEYILNYLRCPDNWVLPEFKIRYNVKREAEFYGVAGLVKLFSGYTDSVELLRSEFSSFVMLLEECNGGTNVKLHLPLAVAQSLCKCFPMLFHDDVKTALNKDGSVIFDYGHVYSVVGGIIRGLRTIGYHVIATANPNTTHTQYIFEAI